MVSATTWFARVTMTEPTIVCNRPTAGGLTPSCAVATRNMPHPLTLEQIACGVAGAPPSLPAISTFTSPLSKLKLKNYQLICRRER